MNKETAQIARLVTQRALTCKQYLVYVGDFLHNHKFLTQIGVTKAREQWLVGVYDDQAPMQWVMDDIDHYLRHIKDTIPNAT